MTQTQLWPEFDRVLIVDLASNGRELAGTVQIELWEEPQTFGGTAYIYALWVDEKHRRYLVGNRLLQAAERIARERGHQAVRLRWSADESPAWVLDWYRRCGYAEEIAASRTAILKKTLTPKE